MISGVESPLRRIVNALNALPEVPVELSDTGLRPAVAMLLDQLGEAVAVYAPPGVPLFENRALLSLLKTEAGAAEFRRAVAPMIRRTGPRPGSIHHITIRGRSLGVDAAVLPADFLWPAGSRLIRVMPLSARRLDPSRVEAEFGLTRRQAQVAVLLAQGLKNREIAGSLGIREHTCRRHTEQVLARLGAPTRARVACLLGGQRIYSM
jgi:DNA-binding CsgD family transcriptional regulator